MKWKKALKRNQKLSRNLEFHPAHNIIDIFEEQRLKFEQLKIDKLCIW